MNEIEFDEENDDFYSRSFLLSMSFHFEKWFLNLGYRRKVDHDNTTLYSFEKEL